VIKIIHLLCILFIYGQNAAVRMKRKQGSNIDVKTEGLHPLYILQNLTETHSRLLELKHEDSTYTSSLLASVQGHTIDGNVGFKIYNDEHRPMYIISQPGLCDENEIFTEQIALLRNWAID
jgi:hypothetical protein